MSARFVMSATLAWKDVCGGLHDKFFCHQCFELQEHQHLVYEYHTLQLNLEVSGRPKSVAIAGGGSTGTPEGVSI